MTRLQPQEWQKQSIRTWSRWYGKVERAGLSNCICSQYKWAYGRPFTKKQPLPQAHPPPPTPPPITAHYPGAKFSSRNHLAPHFDALGARNCLSYVSNEMKRFVLPVNPLTTTPPAPPSTSPLGLVTTHPPGTHSNGITVIMPWLLPLTHTHTHRDVLIHTHPQGVARR